MSTLAKLEMLTILFNMTPMDKTQPLPTNWTWTRTASTPEPRRRYPRNTASLAQTTELPVIGRVGSREFARNQMPCFGGEETR